jgi:hypothetical protein
MGVGVPVLGPYKGLGVKSRSPAVNIKDMSLVMFVPAAKA